MSAIVSISLESRPHVNVNISATQSSNQPTNKLTSKSRLCKCFWSAPWLFLPSTFFSPTFKCQGWLKVGGHFKSFIDIVICMQCHSTGQHKEHSEQIHQFIIPDTDESCSYTFRIGQNKLYDCTICIDRYILCFSCYNEGMHNTLLLTREKD